MKILNKLKKLMIGLPLLIMACAQGPIEGGATTENFQGWYTDEICQMEPVYVNYGLALPDLVRRVDSNRVMYSFLGPKFDKNPIMYGVYDGRCTLALFERVKPKATYKLGPWFEGNR